MSIYISLSSSRFSDELNAAGFGPMSYDLAEAFYDFLDTINENGYELDCVALRCEFALWINKAELVSEYGSDITLDLLAEEGHYDGELNAAGEPPLVNGWLASQPMDTLLDLLAEYGSLDMDTVVCYCEEQVITHKY